MKRSVMVYYIIIIIIVNIIIIILFTFLIHSLITRWYTRLVCHLDFRSQRNITTYDTLKEEDHDQQKRDHLAWSTSQQILKAYTKWNLITQQLFKLKDLNGVELISTNCSVVCRDLLDLELSLIISTSSPSAFRIV